MTGKQSKLHDRCAATQHGFMGSWGSTRWGSHRAMWGEGWTGNLWRWGGSTDCPKLEFFFDGIDDVGYTLKSLGLRWNLNHQQPPEGVYGWWPAHGDDEGWPLIWLVKNSGWRDVVLDVNIQLGWHPRLTSIGVTWNFLAAWRSEPVSQKKTWVYSVPNFFPSFEFSFLFELNQLLVDWGLMGYLDHDPTISRLAMANRARNTGILIRPIDVEWNRGLPRGLPIRNGWIF